MKPFDKTQVRVISVGEHVSCMLPLANDPVTKGVTAAGTLEADLMHFKADDTTAEDDVPAFKLSAFWIARIIVPQRYRGQGAGRAMLSAFLAHMDKTQSFAVLAPNAYDSNFTQQRLVEWYLRNDFVEVPRYKGMFIRKPKPVVLTEAVFDSEY